MFCLCKIAMANPQVETQQTDEMYNKLLIWISSVVVSFFVCWNESQLPTMDSK